MENPYRYAASTSVPNGRRLFGRELTLAACAKKALAVRTLFEARHSRTRTPALGLQTSLRCVPPSFESVVAVTDDPVYAAFRLRNSASGMLPIIDVGTRPRPGAAGRGRPLPGRYFMTPR